MKTITITAIAALLCATPLAAQQTRPWDCDIIEGRWIEQLCHDEVEDRIEYVEKVKEREVADGAVFEKDNLTSMGYAASDGATIMRIRSSQAQTVHLRKAGGGTQVFEVGPGDTFVEVPGPGTYIADFKGTGASKTKATGPQTFPDVHETLMILRDPDRSPAALDEADTGRPEAIQRALDAL